MYIVSKLYWIAVQPLSLSLILVLFGIAAGLFQWRRSQMLFSLGAGLVLFVTLFTTTGSLLLQVLEDRFPRPTLLADPGCLLVLGGGFESEITDARGGYELNQSGDRYVEMIRLARLYPQAKLLVSGGDGHFTSQFEDDVAIARRMFADFGLSTDRVLGDPISRNTYENAVNSSRIMRENGIAECVMITSAFHMPRAMGMFRRVGARVQPWAVDYRTNARTGFAIDIGDPGGNAQQMTTAIREWSGLVGNYVAGRTEALFPAP